MSGTTEIEKKSLEAHVELCAERYNALEDKMVAMGANIAHLCEMLQEVKSTINDLHEKSTDRMIAWGVGIIGTLIGTIAWLVTQYVIK
jgi:prefoldin subunit 5